MQNYEIYGNITIFLITLIIKTIKGASPVSQQALRLKLESYKIKGLRQLRAAARRCSGFVSLDLAFPFLPLDV
ncbi:MAG: hypothetical protein SOW45_06825, partial [Prevotella sp.]|nr:hypothetical protein [Prevotella sp.]